MGNRFVRRYINTALFTALLATAGCGGDGVQRYDLSGVVTYNNQPVPAGTIVIDPDVAKGNDGPQSYAHIRDGRYQTADTDSGHTGGPHRIQIRGYDGHSAPELPLGKQIFEYNVELDLPREDSTRDFNIPAQDAVSVP